MEITYQWRELSSDGLLLIPRDVGPYYDTDNLNEVEGGSFTTKELALKAFDDFNTRQEYLSKYVDYILVEIYHYE